MPQRFLMIPAIALFSFILHAAPETGRADAAWDLCMRTCWSPKTSLVYTCPPDKVKPAREFDDGPGYFHWRKGDPVKGTYGKGMGDCALICGTALSGLVDRWMVRPDDATRETAAKVARGLLNLASLHGRPGFVARGICEEDGRSVCSQSSIDQYTHWVHGLFRYAKSGMADEAFLRDWRRAIADVAQFLQSRCTPERNWNFGRFDGSDDPRGICAMWGPDLKAHAVARLPAIYLAAYDATGDRRWKAAYDAVADEALERSLGLADTKALYGTPCYILLQAQCSFEVIAALERDPARLGKLRKAMKAAAADARRRIGVLARRPDQKFYGMCFDGELALALLMGGDAVSSAERDFVLGLAAKTRVDRPEVCRAAHVLAAEWRLARSAAPEKKVLGEASRVDGVDQWAMAVCTEGDRLYAAAGTSLYAFDISEPLKPKLLGSVSGFDNRRQVVAQGNFVYVVSRETGMRIVDARDPAHMRIRSRFDSVEFATGIDVVGDVAFLSERINGVECVDVSDPDHPAHICIRKTGESQSCRYRNGWLYSGEWGGGNVTVFDAHDMKDFHEVGSLDLHGFGDGVELDGDYLYCSTGHDARHNALAGEEAKGRGRGMDIFSLKDPAKPTWVSRVDFPRFTPRNEDFWTPRVSCGLAFCCDSHNGLFVVDVKDPAKPSVVDRFCVPQEGRDWPSGAISSLAIGKGCVYVTSFPGGLYVIPVEGLEPAARPKGTPPVNAHYREAYPTDDAKFHVWKPAKPGQARTVLVTNDLVYAACGDAGLHVLRIRPEGGFERIGGLPDGVYAYDCAFIAGKLFVAEGLAGYGVYELDGPAGFREVARRGQLSDRASVAYWVWPAGGRFAVLSGRCSGYCFYDAADIDAAKPLFETYGTCQWDKYLCDRAIDGVLPLLVPYQGMRWLDVSGTVPRQIEYQKGGHDDVGSQCNGVCAFGPDKFLYTVGAGYALAGTDRKFGPVKPLPAVPGISEGKGYFGGIPRSDGRWVALTGRSTRRLAVFDFADPEKPVLSRAYRLSGNPDLAAFHNGRVVVPCGHQGVLMER